MNKLMWLLLLVLGMGTALEDRAHAQITGTVDFTTDFAFYVGNALMPAGAYTIRQDSPDTPVLLIEGAKALQHSALTEYTPTLSNAIHKTSEVTFQRFGDRDYLSEIWVEGEQAGVQIEPTKAERFYIGNKQPKKHSVTGKRHGKR